MNLTLIANTVLNAKTTDLHRRKALNDFSTLCSKLSKIEPDPSYTAWSDDTYLDHGVAINPKAAAFCINDYQRTIVFINGVFDALKQLEQQIDKSKSIRILYAGCGPFATLLLPLLPLFDPQRFAIYLIDIHQESLSSVGRLLEAFNLSHYNISLIKGDACDYQHETQLDLIIIETMQKALEQEPQLVVTNKLAPQLSAKGILVPETITVDLCLADRDKEQKQRTKPHGSATSQVENQTDRHHIKRLITLSSTTAVTDFKLRNHQNERLKEHAIPLGSAVIPQLVQLTRFQPLLLTHIKVFGKHELKTYDCSLTLPSPCAELEPLSAGDTYEAWYTLKKYPKIEWQKVEGTNKPKR